jgi:hypothetical protein
MRNDLDDIAALLEDLDLNPRVRISLVKLFWDISKSPTGSKPHISELSKLFEGFMGVLLMGSTVIHCSVGWGEKTRKEYSYLLSQEARNLESIGRIFGKLSDALRDPREPSLY